MAMGIYRSSGTIVAQELLDQVRSTGQYTITAITTYCTYSTRSQLHSGRPAGENRSGLVDNFVQQKWRDNSCARLTARKLK